ncbi:SRPBCC family protein [Luteolibacter flavescens]|uniref:SRPBCC family protein n=1 Tax=Luteolibacter flavescens TaxID=1859460 RepID=A0ABT3FV34_9BACT|nr:SRPBCC family protein [Luteolibacter flavescens]MCW1886840.1 SRPBCC family protein [Luteolibacter flavescens]
MLHSLYQEQTLPLSLDEAWSFFSSPRNLEAMTPPDLGFRIIHCPSDTMHEGQIIEYRVKALPLLWMTWVTEIKAVEDRRSFIDEQRFGPYRFWHHRHTFEAVEGGVKMTDLVHYALPFGPLGEIAHGLFVRRKLEGIFRFRREELDRRFGRPG